MPSANLLNFLQYGPIVEIDLKVPPRPPGYAFVEVSSFFAKNWITKMFVFPLRIISVGVLGDIFPT